MKKTVFYFFVCLILSFIINSIFSANVGHTQKEIIYPEYIDKGDYLKCLQSSKDSVIFVKIDKTIITAVQ